MRSCLYLFQAMVSVLCCGPCFDDAITEDDTLYNFLDSLLEYHDPKVTFIFTFGCNPNTGQPKCEFI